LAPLEPQKVILFDSYTYGAPSKNSDIDLYAVTKDDFLPKNWKEKSEVHLKVAKALQDILKLYPTDLITHTKPMHEKFVELNTTFAREIMQKGVAII